MLCPSGIVAQKFDIKYGLKRVQVPIQKDYKTKLCNLSVVVI